LRHQKVLFNLVTTQPDKMKSHMNIQENKWLVALALCASASMASANTVSNGGYTATDSLPYQWIELANPNKTAIEGATRVLGNHDDAYTSAISLGFNFTLFNQTYSQVFITSNGLLTFGSSTTNNVNNSLGQAQSFSTMPFVAVAWDDWTTTPSGTDGVYYKTSGVAGSQTFAVEWRNTKHYDKPGESNTSLASFEAVLHEGSNAIDLQYNLMNTGGNAANGGSATVGIRDVNAHLNGRYLQWSNEQAVIASGMRITIAPVPEPESYALLLAGLGLMGAVLKRRQTRQV
jgi:hypothetical protein